MVILLTNSHFIAIKYDKYHNLFLKIKKMLFINSLEIISGIYALVGENPIKEMVVKLSPSTNETLPRLARPFVVLILILALGACTSQASREAGLAVIEAERVAAARQPRGSGFSD